MINQSELKNIPANLTRLSFGFNEAITGNSKILEMGKLKLETEKENLLFQATSGLPGHQHLAGSTHQHKGRIPSCKQANILNYFVSTLPIWLPNLKGVNGNFYPITPFVVSINRELRSDLGIHRDTNVPGSSGCLVIPPLDHWLLFEVSMRKLRESGVKQIPLFVS